MVTSSWATSPWATLRFRRSKDVKGWALLGIPQCHYPEVIQSLFEQQTRLIEKHRREDFVNVLFEAPVVLAVRFALAFPAPPGCEPLVVNQAGNRLLYGKFAQSPKARHQLKEGDVRPLLTCLSGEESFWQMVVAFSSITMPLSDNSLGPGLVEASVALVSGDGQVAKVGGELCAHAAGEHSGLEMSSLKLIQGDFQPDSAAVGPTLTKCADPKLRSGETSLDEEGFEEDDWEDAAVVPTPAEAFEDVWDMNEEGDFGDSLVEPDVRLGPPVRVELPFEASPIKSSRSSPPGHPSQQELERKLSGSQVRPVPLLPEESWAAVPKCYDSDASVEVMDWGNEWEGGNELEDGIVWEPTTMVTPLHGAPDAGHHNVLVSASIEPVSIESVPVDVVCLPVLEEEHRHILLQGVAVWNAWRLANPHLRPNLRGAYLNNLDLAGADLHDVDLRFAFLFRANLRSADLSLASLTEADLIRADLAGASLWGAALKGAYLNHANLAGADLTQADLQDVYWQGAILAGTIMPNGQLFEEQ